MSPRSGTEVDGRQGRRDGRWCPDSWKTRRAWREPSSRWQQGVRLRLAVGVAAQRQREVVERLRAETWVAKGVGAQQEVPDDLPGSSLGVDQVAGGFGARAAVLGAGAGLGPQWHRSDGLADVFGGLWCGDVEGQVVDDG